MAEPQAPPSEGTTGSGGSPDKAKASSSTATSTPAPTQTPKTPTNPPAPPPVPPPPAKRQPALLPEEVVRMKEMGLGRGVDGTSPTPWLNKTAFQVRKVTNKTIVGTAEGGTAQSYVREVSSVRSQQSTLKASIDVPKSPVTIGVDAEYSRTFTRSRKSVGNRVHNRTIAFVSDFDDVSDWGIHEYQPDFTTMTYDLISPTAKTTGNQDTSEDDEDKVKEKTVEPPQTPTTLELTFEQRMCKWVLDEVKKPKPKPKTKPGAAEAETIGAPDKPEESTSILEEFSQLFSSFTAKKVREIIDPLCLKFIDYFRITHYVSAIQLGATKYEVMDEDVYARKIGGNANAAVEKIGALDFLTTLNWNRKVSDSRASQIGVLRSDKVRGMTCERNEEAVIGAQIKPLSSLIRHPLLRASLERALKSYMNNVQDDREGPFLISCNDDQIYLKVNEQSQVVGVEDHKTASSFFLVPTYDSRYPREFAITHFSEKKFRDIDPVPRYLSITINTCGRNNGPLTMKFDVKEHESRLILHSRLSSPHDPVEITPWVTGREAYYVSTARRPFKRKGYICVKRRGGRYITACVPSVEYHSETLRQFMVFRLIRPSLFKGGAVEGGEVEGIESDADENVPDHPGIPLGGRLISSSSDERPLLRREPPNVQIELKGVESDI